MGKQYLDANGVPRDKSSADESREALSSYFSGKKQSRADDTPNTYKVPVAQEEETLEQARAKRGGKTTGQMLQEQIEARRKSMADSAGAEPRSYSTPESESSGYSGRAAGAKSAGEAYSSYEPGTSDEDKESHE